jgi:hypothetical protein
MTGGRLAFRHSRLMGPYYAVKSGREKIFPEMMRNRFQGTPCVYTQFIDSSIMNSSDKYFPREVVNSNENISSSGEHTGHEHPDTYSPDEEKQPGSLQQNPETDEETAGDFLEVWMRIAVSIKDMEVSRDKKNNFSKR